VTKLYGEYGASRAGLVLIDCQAEKHFAIVRTFHTTVDTVRAALATITKIADKPVALHVLAVSGTLKALRTRVSR
jgi:RNase P/RNase MRP subunit POP5